MKRRDLFALAAAGGAASALTGCGDQQAGDQEPEGTRVLTAKAQRVAAATPAVSGRAVQAFGSELFLASTQGTGNQAISPYSVYVALGMAFLGARGRTASQFADVLGSDARGVGATVTAIDSAVAAAISAGNAVQRTAANGGKAGDPWMVFSPANAVYLEKSFDVRVQFVQQLAAGYAAPAYQVDFATRPDDARRAINGWVNTKTHKLISELLPASLITSDARVVLVNALYLRARWGHEFAAPSGAHTFTMHSGAIKKVAMMKSEEPVTATSGAGWQAARIPYAGERIAMTILLPDPGKFAAVRSALATVLPLCLQPSAAMVKVSMPPFAAQSAMALEEPLKQMGLTDTFSDEKADLSGMRNSGPPLYTTAVQHQSVVKVDQYGTVAAAATAVVDEFTSGPPPAPAFVVNRPFFFIIHDTTTNAPLFIGQITDPTG